MQWRMGTGRGRTGPGRDATAFFIPVCQRAARVRAAGRRGRRPAPGPLRARRLPFHSRHLGLPAVPGRGPGARARGRGAGGRRHSERAHVYSADERVPEGERKMGKRGDLRGGRRVALLSVRPLEEEEEEVAEGMRESAGKGERKGSRMERETDSAHARGFPQPHARRLRQGRRTAPRTRAPLSPSLSTLSERARARALCLFSLSLRHESLKRGQEIGARDERREREIRDGGKKRAPQPQPPLSLPFR